MGPVNDGVGPPQVVCSFGFNWGGIEGGAEISWCSPGGLLTCRHHRDAHLHLLKSLSWSKGLARQVPRLISSHHISTCSKNCLQALCPGYLSFYECHFLQECVRVLWLFRRGWSKEEFWSSLVMLLNSSPCQSSASDPLLTFLFSAECLLVSANELGDVSVLIYLSSRTSTVLW